MHEGKYKDIYVDPFIEILGPHIPYSVLEKPDSFGHRHPAETKNLFYPDLFSALAKIFALFFWVNKRKRIHQIMDPINERFTVEFNRNINLSGLASEAISRYHAEFFLYYCLFKWKRPTALFVVVSAGHEPVISAAKKLKIPTIELQHGSPVRGKLNYDYSSGTKKRYFPDCFLSFGHFWTDKCKLPIKHYQIFSLGYPYLETLRATFNSTKKRNIITVIGQTTVTSQLTEFALRLQSHLSERVSIIYKPHPSEFRQPHRYLIDAAKIKGLNVADENSDLYGLLAKSRWVLGVYSTAIYESLAFGVFPYILNVSGSELVGDLIHEKCGKLVANVEDVDLRISKKTNTQKFFKSIDREELMTFLRTRGKLKI